MPKRVPSAGLTVWEWFSTWARKLGVDPESVEIADAAEYLVTALEQKRAAGNPLPAALVQLAALLVAIAGELETEGIEPTWVAAQSKIELTCARRHAAALETLRDHTPIPRAKPQILEPEETADSDSVSVYDLVRIAQDNARAVERIRRRRAERTPHGASPQSQSQQ